MLLTIGLAISFLLSSLSFAVCSYCDQTCGDWSCITNCPPEGSEISDTYVPTFDTQRCFVDNGNGQLDDCSELQQCQLLNGKYVCPPDIGDPVCTGSCNYDNLKYLDTDPANFDSQYFTFAKTRTAVTWQEYNNFCGNAQPVDWTQHKDFVLTNYGSPLWVRGGILYWDAWFSMEVCGKYQSFDGSQWRVKNNDCSFFPRVWERMENRCYPTTIRETVYMKPDPNSYYQYVTTLSWDVGAPPQCNYYQEQQYTFNGQNYKAVLKCLACETVEGNQLCSQFENSFYDSQNALIDSFTYDVSSFTCPPPSNSFYGATVRTYMSSSGQGSVLAPVEERIISDFNFGTVYWQEVKCRPCGTDLNQLGGGLPPKFPDDTGLQRGVDDFLKQCTPRLFSGTVERCRPGGVLVLGASCCGISGWFKNICKPPEKKLKKKRLAGLCSYVGDYCAQKILGFCIQKKRTYCCFYSRISKIINECGRPQIGKNFGSGKNPDCRGFTLEEFGYLDLSDPACEQAIQEYIAEMTEKLNVESKFSTMYDRIKGWFDSQKNTSFYNRDF